MPDIKPIQKYPGVILAGGKSTRMGFDKASAMINGRSLLQTVIDRLTPQVDHVAINTNATPSLIGSYTIIPDITLQHMGPLTGILSAMRFYEQAEPPFTHIGTVPVDSPFFPHNLFDTLASEVTALNMIVTAKHNGQIEPVFSLWPISLVDYLHAHLMNDDNKSIKAFLNQHDTKYVEFSSNDLTYDPFMNINNQDDLASAKAIATNIDK